MYNTATTHEIEPSGEVVELRRGILSLSAREMEVLHLVATGKTNCSIGMELGISERTAREHVARIMLKLGVGSRVEIAVIATKWRFEGALSGRLEASSSLFARIIAASATAWDQSLCTCVYGSSSTAHRSRGHISSAEAVPPACG
ncbi:response regulator transcription factor [Streptomyces sp. NPDC056411]|uniref:response regulator transcription factor n=1 Tax=Streptomyces sp. NPDC056411 TaxID=3345813 RepID=UPI0035DEB85A